MQKKAVLGLFFSGLLVAVSGCATGRNYQADIDSLNARISALQGQLSSKDEEINRLQNQAKEESQALSRAEAEKRALSDKLDSALSKLEEKSRQQETQAAPPSDLK